jgi:large subunit ribosomal protein L14e
MQLYGVGRVCVKLAGRDAGKRCVIVDVKENHMVLVDGETRRRLCNVKHLEPLAEKLDIAKGASHADVAAAFKALGVEARETKPKKAAARPKRVRKAKEVSPETSVEKKQKKVKAPKKEPKGEQKE